MQIILANSLVELKSAVNGTNLVLFFVILFNYVVNELTYGESQQKLIDTIRETHFYCLQSYEKILNECRSRVKETDDIDVVNSYHELIGQTEIELAKLKKQDFDNIIGPRYFAARPRFIKIMTFILCSELTNFYFRKINQDINAYFYSKF